MFCLRCGYDLQQLTARMCPECGRAFHPQNPRTYSDGRSSHRWRRWLAAATCYAVMLVVIKALWSFQLIAIAWWNGSRDVQLRFSGEARPWQLGPKGTQADLELSPLASWMVVLQGALIVVLGATVAAVLWRALTRVYVPVAAHTPLFRLTWRRFNVFLILLMVLYFGSMLASWVCGEIDYQRIKSGQQPRFAVRGPTYADGGTVVYQGFYYRLTRHRSMMAGRNKVVFFQTGPEIEYVGHDLWPWFGRLRRDCKETRLTP